MPSSKSVDPVKRRSPYAYSLPQSPDLVSVLQYRFIKGNPPMSCPAPRVSVIYSEPRSFLRHRHVFLKSAHHSAIENLRLLDLDGHGERELVLQSNPGGACQTESGLI